MNDWLAFFFVVLGIVASVALPACRKILWPKRPDMEPEGHSPGWFQSVVKPVLTYYGKYLVASLVVGALAFAFAKSQGMVFTAWYHPFLFGFAADSVIQKLTQGQLPNG